MKSLLQTTCSILLILLLASCSGSSSKFVGKWVPVQEEMSDGRHMVIEKKGESFNLYRDDKPEDFYSFTYDKDNDLLTATQQGETVDIRYVDSNNHITMGPRGGGGFGSRKMELKKLD